MRKVTCSETCSSWSLGKASPSNPKTCRCPRLLALPWVFTALLQGSRTSTQHSQNFRLLNFVAHGPSLLCSERHHCWGTKPLSVFACSAGSRWTDGPFSPSLPLTPLQFRQALALCLSNGDQPCSPSPASTFYFSY